MKNTALKTLFSLFCLIAAAGCTTMNPGEVGVMIHKGRIRQGILNPGRYHYNPFVTRIYKFSSRVTEFSAVMSPPSKEGLEVKMDLTLLYHIKPDAAPEIYTRIGTDYGKKIVINNFMAIVREYTMRYTAVELLNERETIEKNIEDKLKADIAPYGIVVDDVLVKDIDMPAEVLRAIEDKARAEQVAKQKKLELQTRREQEDFDLEVKRKEMLFAVEKQKSEAERLKIEAEATRDFNNTLNNSLTDKTLKYKSLEITRDLVKSPNTKTVILDGKTVLLPDISGK